MSYHGFMRKKPMDRALQDPPTPKRIVARSAFSSPHEHWTVYGTNPRRLIEALPWQRNLEPRRPMIKIPFRFVSPQFEVNQSTWMTSVANVCCAPDGSALSC